MKKVANRGVRIGVALTLVFSAWPASAQSLNAGTAPADLRTITEQAQAPTAGAGSIEGDGTVDVPAFRLPPSSYVSDQTRAAMPRAVSDPMAMMQHMTPAQIAGARIHMGELMGPQINPLKAMYHVTTREGTIAGLPTVFFSPEGGVPAANRNKILLNLPGGGWVMGVAAGTGSVESIPLSALAGVNIVSVTYHQAPETRFPAASDDVVRVYRELLRTHRPQDIGIFGCSAGGELTAQAMARFQREHLPLPAAIGIFCASADARFAGDSRVYNRPFSGLGSVEGPRGYFEGVDMTDPMVSPLFSQDLLSHFPPTLLISGTRAVELSSALTTHRALLRAGVETQMQVWDGLGHAFFYDPRLPESRQAFDVMTAWFRTHLHLAAVAPPASAPPSGL